MRGNLYAVNTVTVVVVVHDGGEETVEFRHLIESSGLSNACIVANIEEEKRCKDEYSEVKKVSVVSGELLVKGDEVVVDSFLRTEKEQKEGPPLKLVTDD